MKSLIFCAVRSGITLSWMKSSIIRIAYLLKYGYYILIWKLTDCLILFLKIQSRLFPYFRHLSLHLAAIFSTENKICYLMLRILSDFWKLLLNCLKMYLSQYCLMMICAIAYIFLLWTYSSTTFSLLCRNSCHLRLLSMVFWRFMTCCVFSDFLIFFKFRSESLFRLLLTKYFCIVSKFLILLAICLFCKMWFFECVCMDFDNFTSSLVKLNSLIVLWLNFAFLLE